MQPTLWDAPPAPRAVAPPRRLRSALERGEIGRERAARAQAPLLAALRPIAIEMEIHARGAGITVAEVRKEARARGILTGRESRETMSCLGALMKSCGFVPASDMPERSDVPKTHGNRNLRWRQP